MSSEARLPHLTARRTLGWILVAALTGGPWSIPARAQARSGGAVEMEPTARFPDREVQTSRLVAERLRLQGELVRANAEIDALKRQNRGLRDDYRLRSRMADAEALARRLTDLDARLPRPPASGSSSSGGRPTDAARAWMKAPEATPADDRAVLEAKADLLSDQARHLTKQAEQLAGRVTDLQARSELRRRAGQLERDPFSPLEQARRRLTATGTPGRGDVPSGSAVAGGVTPDKSAPGNAASVSGPTEQAGRGTSTVGVAIDTSGPAPTAPPTASIAGPASVVPGAATGAPAGASPGAAAVTAPVSTTPIPSSTTASVNKAQPSLITGSAFSDNLGSFASQFRGVLDPSTLAEIQRLEVSGSPSGNVAAMQRALTALRARAAELASTASAMRNQAGKHAVPQR